MNLLVLFGGMLFFVVGWVYVVEVICIGEFLVLDLVLGLVLGKFSVMVVVLWLKDGKIIYFVVVVLWFYIFNDIFVLVN